MNRNKAVILVIVMLLLGLLLYVGRSNRRTSPLMSKPDTYDTGVNGYKALYLLCGRVGFMPERNLYPPVVEEFKAIKSLVILSPSGINPSHAKALMEWVEKGNNLIMVSEEDNPFLEQLGVRVTHFMEDPEKTGDSDQKPEEEDNLTWKRFLPKTRKIRNVAENSPFKNVKEIEIVEHARLKIPPGKGFDVFLEDEKGVICGGCNRGTGRVILMTTPMLFSNIFINRADNVLFIINIFKLISNDKIYFDEYFHGYASLSGNFRMPDTVSFILYQVGGSVLLFYLIMMIRFGIARRPEQIQVRTSSEYVYSLAGLFQKASSEKYALDNLLKGFKRKLSRLYGIPYEVSHEKLLKLLTELPGINSQEAKSLIEDCKKMQKEGNYPLLKEIAKKLDDIIMKASQRRNGD